MAVDGGPSWRRSLAAPALPVLVAALAGVLPAILGQQLLGDPDTQWHIASGLSILDDRALPHEDVWSLTRRGSPWIAKEWGAQVLLAAAYRSLGWAGVVAAASLAMAAAFGVLATALRRRLGPLPVAVLSAAAWVLAAEHVLARPHALALPVAVAWTAALLRRADEGSTPPWTAIPLVILWANLHAGFPLAVAIAGGAGLIAVVEGDRGSWRPRAGRWAGFTATTALAGLVTPYGAGSYVAALDVLTLGEALTFIREWARPDLLSLHPLPLTLLAAVVAAGWLRIRPSWPRLLFVAGLVVLAMRATRNADLLGLLAPLALAAPIASARPSFAAAPRPRRPTAGLVASWSAAAGVIAALALALPVAPPPRVAPVAAVAALDAAHLDRVLNDYDFGGHLVLVGRNPWIDGRTEFHGEEAVVAHFRAVGLLDPGALEAILERHDIEATLLRATSPAVAHLDGLPGWERLHQDAVAVVHRRVTD